MKYPFKAYRIGRLIVTTMNQARNAPIVDGASRALLGISGCIHKNPMKPKKARKAQKECCLFAKGKAEESARMRNKCLRCGKSVGNIG